MGVTNFAKRASDVRITVPANDYLEDATMGSDGRLASETLVGSVKEWLETKSGYPLEMAVAAALSKSGFAVVQGDYFRDFDGDREVSREVDVTGYVTHGGSNVQVSAALVIECKSTPKPWLLFSYPHGYSETLQVVRRCATSQQGHRILQKLQFNEDARQLELLRFLPHTGYGLAVAHKDSNVDTAYSALMSVCKATLAHVEHLRQRIIPFDWPIIVTRGPLLECRLDEENQLEVRQIDRGTLVWRNPIINATTVVDVYTLPAFEQHVASLYAAADKFAPAAWQVAMDLAGIP